MSTIAWDGSTLAGDRRVSFGQGRMGTICKIARRTSDGAMIGAVGTTPIAQALIRWFMDGEQGDPPKLDHGKDDTATGFVVRPDGTIDDITACGIARMTADIYARGSGAHYALGAMSQGANAKRAIQVAALWDNGTGDGVDTLETVRVVVALKGEAAG